ncbi:microsomal glutathione S-transferase 2 isoform X2 [Mobula hypostoma]|uniref:microsomal glutathione S-transferase 2 isoform X2 n=1 Tax=Mobula hypostoma TaxID=723540 RepID=UPI002FC2B466
METVTSRPSDVRVLNDRCCLPEAPLLKMSSMWKRLVFVMELTESTILCRPSILCSGPSIPGSDVTSQNALHAYFAVRVGNARKKYKVLPPAVTGSPDFERIFRAQQNSVEFYPMFLIVLWSSGLFFNQEIASIVGLLYLFSRFMYFNEYAKSAKRRLPGFRIGIAVLLILASMSIGGITNSLFDKYFDFNIAKKIKKMIL